MSEIPSYVVVTFGSSPQGWCTLSHCPMESFGPFRSRYEAHQFAATLPEWQQPHIVLLNAAAHPAAERRERPDPREEDRGAPG